MERHSDQGAIERAAAVIIKVADRYSNDELDSVLKTARRAIESSLKETSAEINVGRTLIEAIDAARSMLQSRADRGSPRLGYGLRLLGRDD